MQCCLEPPRKHCIEFWPVQCYAKSIKTTLDRFFLMKYSLEPRRQYCIEFSAVNYCPNSIKTTLQRIFSDAMLSGAFRVTLHRVLTCAISSQEYQGKIAQDFLYAMLSGASRTALHRVFYRCNVVPRVLRQHCTGFFLMQNCLEPLGRDSIEFSAVQCYLKGIKTTLDHGVIILNLVLV